MWGFRSMQSRNYFFFGPLFNIATNSVFLVNNQFDSHVNPPEADYLATEDLKYILTENDERILVTSERPPLKNFIVTQSGNNITDKEGSKFITEQPA